MGRHMNALTLKDTLRLPYPYQVIAVVLFFAACLSSCFA